MLSFPTSTVFERRIPKQKFYQNLDVTAEVKRLFIEQIKLITWANKLSAQTMNLAPGQTFRSWKPIRLFRPTAMAKRSCPWKKCSTGPPSHTI